MTKRGQERNPMSKKIKMKRRNKGETTVAITGPGRPKGAPNANVETQTVDVSTCPKCGSTERGKYYNVRCKPIAGRNANGRAYSAVTWKRCRCEACGQVRDDRSYVYGDPF